MAFLLPTHHKAEHPHQKTHEGSSLHPVQPLEDPRDSSTTPVLLPSCWGQQDLKNWLDRAVYSLGLLNRRFSLKYYQVRKTKSSVPQKWFTRWLAALCQPNQERSLLIPSLKKPQPTKQNIRGWSRKIWPIEVGNKEKIPRGIFLKLLNANALSIICTKIKMYKPLISLVPSIFPQGKGSAVQDTPLRWAAAAPRVPLIPLSPKACSVRHRIWSHQSHSSLLQHWEILNSLDRLTNDTAGWEGPRCSGQWR